jgi:pimeloyl-ACP methyl ester carboxylesterase
MYKDWAATFLASDPTSSTRSPPSVRIPNGRAADTLAIAQGRFPYDPAKIEAPTLVVMGETDEVTTFAGAQWLLGALRSAPHRRLVVIGHASHTIQFEAERNQLYDVMADFVHEKLDSSRK